jgi:hypothetical protein
MAGELNQIRSEAMSAETKLLEVNSWRMMGPLEKKSHQNLESQSTLGCAYGKRTSWGS